MTRFPKGSVGCSMIIEGRRKTKGKKKKKKILYHKYSCGNGHMRMEKNKLEELPFCTTCHMTKGEYKRLKYIGCHKV